MKVEKQPVVKPFENVVITLETAEELNILTKLSGMDYDGCTLGEYMSRKGIERETFLDFRMALYHRLDDILLDEYKK